MRPVAAPTPRKEASLITPHPASSPPRACRYLPGARRFQSDAASAPDRRGEALDIFTTIFVRPALELREPLRRLVRDLARDRRRDQRGMPNAR